MRIFDIFKGKKDDVNGAFDISKVSDDNVNQFLKSGQLKMIYILSPIFGGSEERVNQIIVTPKAEKEKQDIDEELCDFLKQGKSVKKLNINFEYKGNSIVPSKIIASAIVDGKDYNKVIEVW